MDVGRSLFCGSFYERLFKTLGNALLLFLFEVDSFNNGFINDEDEEQDSAD